MLPCCLSCSTMLWGNKNCRHHHRRHHRHHCHQGNRHHNRRHQRKRQRNVAFDVCCQEAARRLQGSCKEATRRMQGGCDVFVGPAGCFGSVRASKGIEGHLWRSTRTSKRIDEHLWRSAGASKIRPLCRHFDSM